jgi:endo-1,4-beta-mannosidase
MSGRIWWPQWALGADDIPGDLYTEPSLVRSQLLLARECASALGGDSAIRAFDIANEIDDAQRPATREDACVWLSAMTEVIRSEAPTTLVRIGSHLPSLTTENHMRVDDLGSELDEDVMHAYPLYSAFARSFLDPELVPFASALTANLAGMDRAPLMQEFGLCTSPRDSEGVKITDDFLGVPRTQYLASEAEGGAYYDAVLGRLISTGAAGAYAWCYADYDASLFDRPPLDRAIRERTFGLVRADGTEKPAAGVFRTLRRRRDEGDAMRGQMPNVLDVSADEYYRDPSAHFGRLYANWLAEHT